MHKRSWGLVILDLEWVGNGFTVHVKPSKIVRGCRERTTLFMVTQGSTGFRCASDDTNGDQWISVGISGTSDTRRRERDQGRTGTGHGYFDDDGYHREDPHGHGSVPRSLWVSGTAHPRYVSLLPFDGGTVRTWYDSHAPNTGVEVRIHEDRKW